MELEEEIFGEISRGFQHPFTQSSNDLGNPSKIAGCCFTDGNKVQNCEGQML